MSEQGKYRKWTAQQKLEIVLAGLRGDRSVRDLSRSDARGTLTAAGATSCLHRIAVTQARVDPRARSYLDGKIAAGKTKREARRALKRHLSDIVYRRLYTWADQALPPLRT